MNSNTSQAFGFQTGSMSDKQGSLKVKFFNVTDKKENEDDDDPTPRYRLRMVKQLGDLQQWYEILD